MGKTLKIVLIVLLGLLLLGGGALWYFVGSLRDNSVDIVDKPDIVPADTSAPEIITFSAATPEPPETGTPAPIYKEDPQDKEVINVLLVGADSRTSTADAKGNADTMILASISKQHKTVTLISFMRDSWVEVVRDDTTSWRRLNSAYSTGGYGALINTLNYNFGLDIQEYVAVGFENFEQLIDAVGGIDVELNEKEVNFINYKMQKSENRAAKRLEVKDGVVHLDGELALWYARNRSTPLTGDRSGNDFSRVSRQQHVLELVYRKLRGELTIATLTNLAVFAMENCHTNLSMERMVDIGTFLISNDVQINKTHVPFPDEWDYGKGGWIEFDIEQTGTKLRGMLYDAE